MYNTRNGWLTASEEARTSIKESQLLFRVSSVRFRIYFFPFLQFKLFVRSMRYPPCVRYCEFLSCSCVSFSLYMLSGTAGAFSVRSSQPVATLKNKWFVSTVFDHQRLAGWKAKLCIKLKLGN